MRDSRHASPPAVCACKCIVCIVLHESKRHLKIVIQRMPSALACDDHDAFACGDIHAPSSRSTAPKGDVARSKDCWLAFSASRLALAIIGSGRPEQHPTKLERLKIMPYAVVRLCPVST